MKPRWPAPLAIPPRHSALESELQMFLSSAYQPRRPHAARPRRFPSAAPGLGWSPDVDIWTDTTDGDGDPLPPEAV